METNAHAMMGNAALTPENISKLFGDTMRGLFSPRSMQASHVLILYNYYFQLSIF